MGYALVQRLKGSRIARGGRASMPDAPDQDPVVGSSLSAYLLVAAVLLVPQSGLGAFGRGFRLAAVEGLPAPIRAALRHFPAEADSPPESAEKAIRESPEFQALAQKVEVLEQSSRARRKISTAKSPTLTPARRRDGGIHQQAGQCLRREFTGLSIPGKAAGRSRKADMSKFKRGPARLKLPALGG